MDTQIQAGGVSDMLSVVLGVEVREEAKIAAEDRAFCEGRQTGLNATLGQLQRWYALFTAEASALRKRCNLQFCDDGAVDISGLRNYYHSAESVDYSAFEFLPFKAINEVVGLYNKAVKAFAEDIIRYFNRKYKVSVPTPEIENGINFSPSWQIYVDSVFAHLGGRGFREVAEDEVIARFGNSVGPWVKMELRGDKIAISDALRYEDYSWQTELHLKWESTDTLNALCAGVIFGETGALNGSMDAIIRFDRRDVDVSRWYSLVDISVKFYKNGRVDFRFENASAAEKCWRKLKLDKLCIK